MKAELVYDGGEVRIPSTWKKPRDDQMIGTDAEKLIEVAGRCCYDSMGSGRGSVEYHKHLLEVKHYSVHEHVHDTLIVTENEYMAHFLGMPDVAVRHTNGTARVTLNLRHGLEWPDNITYRGRERAAADLKENQDWWGEQLLLARQTWCPNLFGKPSVEVEQIYPDADLIDTEAFVSLFLEDSRVWSHEQVRHRCNISQRSGRFVDETDRAFCIHPLLRDYLNEVGHLKEDVISDGEGYGGAKVGHQLPTGHIGAKGQPTEPMWEGGKLSDNEAKKRTALGSMVGSLLAQSTLTYINVVDALQDYAVSKGMDKLNARKQARSAARYYLPNSLSTEMIFTASIRNWRHIFRQRCSPTADSAIRELMEAARELVKNSRHGHLL